MSCVNYYDFYSTLASSVLVLITIIVALAIYLWQQRDYEEDKLNGEFEDLTELINNFRDINNNACNIPPHPSLNLNLKDLRNKVIERYNRWRKQEVRSNNDEYNSFLQALNSLQQRIYSGLVSELAVISERTPEGDWIYVIKNRWDFERFMDRVNPYLAKAEGVLTSIYSITENHKKYWDDVYGNDERRKSEREFYFNYWNVLLEIWSKSKYIDGKIRRREQRNMLSPIIDSPQSMQFIQISGFLIILFGFIIPLYMLQPNQLGWLRCDVVFYSVVVFIIISIICACMSFRERRRYGMKMIFRIIEDLKNHEDEFTRKRAAEDLGNTGYRIAAKPLKEVIKTDTSEIVRLAAMGALVKLGRTKYFNQLITALKNEDSNVRSIALKILGDIGDPKAVGSIKLLLENEGVLAVRLSAIFALGRIGDSSAVKLLLYYADNDESEVVRTNANHILIGNEF